MAIPARLKKASIIVPFAAVALVIGACSGDESGDDQESRSASAGSVEWKPADWKENPGTAITLTNNSTKPIGFSCAQAPKASRIASPLFTVKPGKFFRCLTKEFIPKNSAFQNESPAVSAVHLSGGSKVVKFWADGIWDTQSDDERALFGFLQSCFGNEAYRAENPNTIFDKGKRQVYECAGLNPSQIAVTYRGNFGTSPDQSPRTGQIRMTVG